MQARARDASALDFCIGDDDPLILSARFGGKCVGDRLQRHLVHLQFQRVDVTLHAEVQVHAGGDGRAVQREPARVENNFPAVHLRRELAVLQGDLAQINLAESCFGSELQRQRHRFRLDVAGGCGWRRGGGGFRGRALVTRKRIVKLREIQRVRLGRQTALRRSGRGKIHAARKI